MLDKHIVLLNEINTLVLLLSSHFLPKARFVQSASLYFFKYLKTSIAS